MTATALGPTASPLSRRGPAPDAARGVALFGFGIAAIAARLEAAGLDRRTGTRLLLRRNGWLFALGLMQVAAVFWGDILGVYGLTGMVVVAMLRRSRGALVAAAIASAVVWTLGTIALNWQGSGDRVPAATNYVVSMGERLAVFVWWTGLNTAFLTHLAPMLVGILLFRSGVLLRPEALPTHPLAAMALGGSAVATWAAIPSAPSGATTALRFLAVAMLSYLWLGVLACATDEAVMASLWSAAWIPVNALVVIVGLAGRCAPPLRDRDRRRCRCGSR